MPTEISTIGMEGDWMGNPRSSVWGMVTLRCLERAPWRYIQGLLNTLELKHKGTVQGM